MTKNIITLANIAANNPPCVDFPEDVQWTDFPERQRRTIVECLMVTQNNMKYGKSYEHIPCKFFKKGKCQAGRTCPFSHKLDYDEACKTPCSFYLKGECKFGDKCVNLHEKVPNIINGKESLVSNQTQFKKINGNGKTGKPKTPTNDTNYIISQGKSVQNNSANAELAYNDYTTNMPRGHVGPGNEQISQETAPVSSSEFAIPHTGRNNFANSTPRQYSKGYPIVTSSLDLEYSNISPDLANSISNPVYNSFAQPEGFPVWSKRSGEPVVGANNTHGKTNYYNTNYYDFNEPITRPLYTTPTNLYDGNSNMRQPIPLAVEDVKYFINCANKNNTNNNQHN
ncbi:similar to Saccharomyces cerevisiae YPL054W LEE1 Zinc-finger protein of unknown function [Maudiozyma barnettii]|uniref:C3H1-type domain-containing protein n=1 Tax=Maudiozyma barnettii TaxID=61262 RepID=A0A8H2VIE5_9SACH|nr:Lee1p [Kazachstania barnettii]CAB4255824.1 similar to Saccharomyces cerevisiae YPL054W LEE1 Zinc-finger protein of unknown function [Kazachstania barnettii]CAD1784385.1 similar to Saccharomyces cerevisiae YPL054W LEE1 Zinc-finger protein of unknown function [Kazachstania barnettii]